MNKDKRGTDGVDVSNGTNSTSVNVLVVKPKLKLKNNPVFLIIK
jgi:hypothetical protein